MERSRRDAASPAELPVHALLSQAAGGQPLGVSSITALLCRRLRVILTLLGDGPHAALMDCT